MPTETVELAAVPPQLAGRGVPIQNQTQPKVKRRAKTTQCVAIQDVLLNAIETTQEPLNSKAQAARAWVDLEELHWQLRGKPKLAPIKSEPKARKQRPTAPLSEGPAKAPPDATA